jgi:hypothetical protein
VEMWLRRLTTMGVRRGMRGSRPWMVTAVVVIGLRAFRRLANPPDEVLFRTRVKPGDRFELLAGVREPRKRRRAAQ